MTTYPSRTIPLSHRIAKPAKRSAKHVQSVNPMLPLLQNVGLLVIKAIMQLGFIVLWALKFGVRLNFRYGVFCLTHDNMPILGLDFSGCLFGSLIVVNSPFGWEGK